MGGDSYREGEERHGEEPVYVIDETQKQATPPGMLSRNRLTHGTGQGVDKTTDESMMRTYVLAGVLGVAILVLGGLGLYSVRAELNAMDVQAEAAAAAKPPPPEDVQGVRVRKGMKHNPLTTPKKPGATIEQENPIPLNSVPDGEPVPDAPPPAEAPDAEAPPPEPSEPATDIPSGDPG